MGRSKFPGKPSKHCHRKRVNVLPPTGELTHGSDSSSVTVIGSSKENKQDEDLSENEGESTAQTEKSKPHREQIPRKLSTSLCKNGRQRNFITKIRNKTPLKNSKATRNNLSKSLVRKEAPNFAGKFVLPTRSVHSSRVIKPNKRFIDLNESINVKKKVLTKRSLKPTEEKSNEGCSDAKDKMAFSNGHKVILRQARLKLPNQVGSQISFSTKLHNGPGTIICGVCGAVRYYRFVKQARKFNIYSCESCRKFISKQIKRQNVGNKNSNILPCQTGQGACYVPPVVRSQHWKIAKCAYRSRCPACWLKMCIKAYHLPLTLKQNLTQLLPKNMRGFDLSFNNSLPPILWQKNVESTNKSPEMLVKQRPVRFKPPQKTAVINVPITSDVKRQKIDLKGPRVKHVCRSASIVLGQPLATFASDNDKKVVVDSQETISDKSTVSDNFKVSDTLKTDSPNITDEELVSNSSFKSVSEKVNLTKKERSKGSPTTSNKEVINIARSEEVQHSMGILLDYSQELNYDNRYKYGFSVVTSKAVSTGAICFLCGSAGVDQMLICSICCEPYHTFCIESFGFRINSEENWMCIRCVPCQNCKGFDRSKVSCPKCLNIYHSDCFNSKEDSNNSKMLCKECRKCQDCGTATAYNLVSFPGNMPFCINCLNKRKIGMYCPICQYSFEENNLTTKMLECSKCKKWVHSECEKLTSEQYDILKLLPISENFTCSHCLNGSVASWHRSVQSELYHNFNQVLRLLIKNKTARSILKKVGLKGSSHFRRQLLTNHTDIDNNNYKKDIDKIYSFEESEKLQKESQSSANTLLDIKNRLCEYSSVKKFNNDMREALKLFHSEQMLIIYKNIFQSVFPWFSQSHEAAEDIPLGPYCHNHLIHKTVLEKVPSLPDKDLDDRPCSLCHNIGDKVECEESRLLYCGNNIWVHANCAYWSINVYEELDNHLQNVLETIERSKDINCSLCNKLGASLQCHICKNDCYHFICARKANFTFKAITKACYCSKHQLDDSEHCLKVNEDFQINRSMFIEQYNKENIRSEPESVSCTIGSLNITNLGKIEPFISDTVDAIIPTGFICYRIFWSTLEPWKLITYIIKTSVQNPNITTLTVDKNFTVDHTLNKTKVDKAMKEVKDWQKIYEKRTDEMDYEDEEEKNGAELLSPELTDTILEDLPHDILDGISVQDIFQNFSYEDMLNLENSNTESIADSLKKTEDDDSTAEAPEFRSTREFVRTKSDPGIKSRIPPLSLTLSYKLDSTIPPITKKRKITKEPPNNMLLLQVDGTFDDSSSSECGSPIGINSISPWGISEEPVTCEKCQRTYRTQASYKRHLDTCEVLCTSESDSENMPEQDINTNSEEDIGITTQPIEVTVQVNEPTQPVLIQAYESYQSQVHTSVVNVVPPDATPQPQSVTVQPTITISDHQPTPATISIPVPLCVGPSLTPQIVQPSIEFQQVQQTQTQPMTLQQVQQVLVQRHQPARRDSVVLQPIQPTPAAGFVPFVDAFGQAQTNQGVQYVQIAPQVQPQTQLLQIRSDGNVIGILPSIQPTTVIVQQPQQLVLDSSGTFGWTQQPQPQIYYGFETIVQNTVMQSQQFLPTPVPGVLTANSSYSTTTQVFQTSKLEPVLDVSSNSFVLVNPSQIEIPQRYPQNQPGAVVTSQNPTIIYSQPSTTQKPIAAAPQNCINLPTAPFVSDQNIPMNIVPPIPKPPTSHGRPMSRVLPMPTNTVKTSKKISDLTKMFPDAEKSPQNKMEDNKFIFSKDLVKMTDSPKSRNRKFEILDYKIIKSRVNQNVDSKQIYRIEEKPFKEFEPIEKLPKLSKYEPLKEIEKVRIELFEEPIKTVKIIDKERYLKLDALKNLDKLDSPLKNLDISPNNIEVVELKPNGKQVQLENNTQNERVENNLQKLENTFQTSELQLNHSKSSNTEVRRIVPEKSIRKTIPVVSNPQKKIAMPSPIVNSYSEPKIIKQDSLGLKAKEQLQEKPLDMPKLDNFDKITDTPINIKESFNSIQNKLPCPSGISEFNIQSHDNNIQNVSRNNFNKPAIIAPLRTSKSDTYIKIEEKSKLLDKEPLAIITEPSPKLPKKEADNYGAPSILYTIENKEGFKYSSTSISDCWAKVWEAVQNARAAHNMPLLPTDGKQLKSVQLIGLKSSHVKYLIEQLPGASKCIKYKTLFNFTPHPLDTVDSSTHGFGAVRCQPRKSRNTDPNDMFSWLSSKHRQPFISVDSQIVQSRRVNNFPMAMKFRNLKQTSRFSVGVYRSKIHGKGLFCLRDIEAGEMVIEYAGEVIRSILTDKREKFYNSKGIGCYMFRVDDNFVVDATMKGNAARFINHSCDPNCYSKVVEIMGHKHIVIFALRRILSGEELTYDYKFPFEEDKIPCTCGARRCRKFLN